MHNEKLLSSAESLNIIQRMIDTAKHEQKDDGIGWITWGWILLLASAGTVLNIYFDWVNIFFFWNAAGVAVFIALIYELVKTFFIKRKTKVKTYTSAIFDKLNFGFFISLLFIIISMNTGISVLKGFPLLMSLYAFWILIYGTLLDHRPSVVGAYVMWLFAFIALFIPKLITATDDGLTHFKWIMILHGLGVLFGYIIPGHMANREFKKLSARKLSKEL